MAEGGGGAGGWALRTDTGDGGADAMAVRFSPDSDLVAAACADGKVRCYHVQSGSTSYTVDSMRNQVDKIPATCLRFRPHREGRAGNVAIIGTAAGEVKHYHLSSKKCLNIITEEYNEVYAVDYRPDGDQFASAGKDGCVRVYDEETRTLAQELKWGGHEERGEPSSAHTSRVQAVSWVPGDPHRMVSAGWDRTIQLWDTRTDQATGSLYGAYVCGDALDVHADGRSLLSGSARDEEQLQLWDLAAPRRPAEVLPLPQRRGGDRGWGSCFAAQYRPAQGGVFAVGGPGGVCLGAISLGAGERADAAPAAFLPADFRAVFSVAWSEDGALLASAGAGGRIAVAAQGAPQP